MLHFSLRELRTVEMNRQAMPCPPKPSAKTYPENEKMRKGKEKLLSFSVSLYSCQFQG